MLKFDPKAHEGIYLGYASTSKAYSAYNKSTPIVEESINVLFDESNALLENCEECAELSTKREIISDGDKEEEIPKSLETLRDFWRETGIIVDHPKD